MEFTAALTADLAILSQALDDPGIDVAASLRHLTSDARLAVPSWLGLAVIVNGADLPVTFTTVADSVQPGDVLTSLRMPTSQASDYAWPMAMIFYAGQAGAFVDLAADLSWLTGRDLTDFTLDQHLTLHTVPGPANGVRAASVINQAIGVLIGRGHTPERARVELDARAAYAGTDRHVAADVILAALTCAHPDSEFG
jgi:hypothetical protein